ncbi:MAG: putative transposase [Gammaproteobacteria bacterium]
MIPHSAPSKQSPTVFISYAHESDALGAAVRKQKILTVRLHPLANESADAAIRHLCAEINATETLFPGTDLRLSYESVSSQNP